MGQLPAYIVPVDTWYIVPVKDIPRNGKFNVFPSHRSKYERYRENWDLLRR